MAGKTMEPLYYILFLAIGMALGVWLRRAPRGASGPEETQVAPPDPGERGPTSGAPRAVPPEPRPTPDPPGVPDRPAIYRLEETLRREYDRISHPRDLARSEVFRGAVRELAASDTTTADLFTYYRGDNPLMACLATAAIAEREAVPGDEIASRVLASINYPAYYVRYFALLAIHARCEPPLISRVLASLDEDWESDFLRHVLEEFLELRQGAGEAPGLDDSFATRTTEQIRQVESIVSGLRESLREPLLADLRRISARSIDCEFLRGIGKLALPEDPEEEGATPFVLHDEILRAVRKTIACLEASPGPRSVLVVGESGVGKTVATTALGGELRKAGHAIFRATAAELVAGQSYIGQLERRVGDLIQNLGGKRIVWLIESFHELSVAGRHRYSTTSVLDMILPHIESGRIRIVGELRPAAFEKLVLTVPRVQSVLETVRMEPLDDETTLVLAHDWVEACGSLEGPRPVVSDASLREALQLVKQYLPSRVAPGNLLEFLKLTWSRLAGDRSSIRRTGDVEMTVDDHVVSMAQLTGLPLEIIDERQSFDLDALSRTFRRTVLGQPEAVDTLVERLAMIKAGLTDPTRPLGVFFFAGPTGTGKTEVAKTLTRFLFGSQERMIRLDMSEFSGGGVSRLLGETGEIGDENTLVNQIRRQPFSLILLDEFEKADPSIWDLFLQVFDDGRLTDQRGNTADFRNSIIILTSNLGAVEAQSPGLGFGQGDRPYVADDVVKAVERTFRREFVNRIDRVVVFRPLSRSVMREILKLELGAVLERRGLRNRPWAVEWDDSTLDFLLERGFSPDLGARPLRRAVERHVLAPLSLAMVRGELPRGDQFLLVRERGGELEFECIDPDADSASLADAPLLEETVGRDDLRTARMILTARGTPQELAHLRREYRELVELLNAGAALQKKEEALARMSEPAFWDSPERFAVLSYVEFLDRVVASVRSAGGLLDRLEKRIAAGSPAVSPRLLRELAQKIYLLEKAYSEIVDGEPRDAFVTVEAGGSAANPGLSVGFARRVLDMYLGWAEARGMNASILHRQGDGEGEVRFEAVIAVEGYGAHAILRAEDGVHLLENPGTSSAGPGSKGVVRVRVVPQPPEPPGVSGLSPEEQARAALAGAGGSDMQVVRRYQESPTPLVRDRVAGWRTGRLDLVLSGNFDILGAL